MILRYEKVKDLGTKIDMPRNISFLRADWRGQRDSSRRRPMLQGATT